MSPESPHRPSNKQRRPTKMQRISSVLKSWWNAILVTSSVLKPRRISSVLKSWWNAILVTSSLIAVAVDSLFLYIPYTSEVKKCLGRDEQLQTVALALRSVTDFVFLVKIINQLYVAFKCAASEVLSEDKSSSPENGSISRDQKKKFAKAFSRKLSWRYFLTDVFAIFPMPQLLIVGLFFDIGGNNYLFRTGIMSGFLLVQYVPKIYRIYKSSSTVSPSALWIKGAYILILYLLASHVLGSFWYFFSIQRHTTCWYQNCIDSKRSESECSFYCHGNITAALITPEFNKTLNDQCILKVPPNMTDPPFDFGMFYDALKNDIQGKMNIPQKIGYCIWWGWRHLSSFGTSLETSTYLWENIFAIVISITGFLLVSYLIGNNIQSYMEIAKKRAQEVRDKIEAIKNWMEDKGLESLDKDTEIEIMTNIEKKLEEDINVDLGGIFSILPEPTKKALTRVLCMPILEKLQTEKVPRLSKDEKVLETICDHLEPVTYEKAALVFQMEKPLDRMVLIIEGRMWTSTVSPSGGEIGVVTSPSTTPYLGKGDYYGDAILQSAPSLTELPKPTVNVRCDDIVVEAFVLTAKRWGKIVNKCHNPSIEDGQFRQRCCL